MLSTIQTFAVTHPSLVYPIIIAIALAEGPFIAMFCGTLLAVGYLHFFPLLLSIIAGDLIGDVVWYFIGYRIGNPFVSRFGKYFRLSESDIRKMVGLFTRYRYPVLFVSKISNGFGLAIAILFTAGLSRVPFAPFIGINLAGETIWSSALIGIGYFFSASLLGAKDTFQRIWIAVSLCVVVCAFLLLRKYLRSTVFDKEE